MIRLSGSQGGPHSALTVDFQSVQLLMNHKLSGVSGNYVTRDRLMDHLRKQVELMAKALSGRSGLLL